VNRREGKPGHVTSPFDAVSLETLRRRRTVKWTLFGPDVLAAWVAEMDFSVAEPIRAALIEAVDREDFGYLPANLSELTSACAGFLASAHGWDVPRRGSSRLRRAPRHRGSDGVFLPAGCQIVVPTPAYPPFLELVRLGGRRVVEAPMAETPGDPVSISTRSRPHSARCAGGAAVQPHNPTGRVFESGSSALAEIVERHGARVVADEVRAARVSRAPSCRTRA
jgi:cystathionine beta-lyase